MKNSVRILSVLGGLAGCGKTGTATLVSVVGQSQIANGPWQFLHVGESEREVKLTLSDAEFTAVDLSGEARLTYPVLYPFNLLREYTATTGEETNKLLMGTGDVPCYVVDRTTPPFSIAAVDRRGAYENRGSIQRADGVALEFGTMAICDEE